MAAGVKGHGVSAFLPSSKGTASPIPWARVKRHSSEIHESLTTQPVPIPDHPTCRGSAPRACAPTSGPEGIIVMPAERIG